MKKVITFGEVMMRLMPPGYALFSQTDSLELTFGGGEANTAISLAYFGIKASHVTRFPNNALGKAGAQYLRRHWLDTEDIIYGGQEMGIYFLEMGAVHRSSNIVYDRAYSAFAAIKPEMFNWKIILKGASWFHFTGITPALSQGAADTCLEAVKTARKLGISVSMDLGYRSNLWNYGKTPQLILPDLVAECDVVIAGKKDILEVLNEDKLEKTKLNFSSACNLLMQTFPNIKKVAHKKRESLNASYNKLRGKLWNGTTMLKTKKLEITFIVDRVGTGDAFAAGLIYGLMQFQEDQKALNFAVAACALKHTVVGDANMVSVEDVQKLAGGDASGKISR
jgi:2-dehydro-3-deoxygluconokinase